MQNRLFAPQQERENPVPPDVMPDIMRLAPEEMEFVMAFMHFMEGIIPDAEIAEEFDEAVEEYNNRFAAA